MAVLLGAGILGALVLTYFTAGAVATLAHWVSVAGGLAVVAAVTYQLDTTDFYGLLGFDSDLWQVASAGVLGSLVGFVSFRILENLFAAVGLAGALIAAVLIVGSIVLSPALVANFVAGVVQLILDFVGGD